MSNVSNYYIRKKEDLLSDKSSYIVGNKYRFTILSPRLIRLEYSVNGKFEDRPTSLVVNRAFPKTEYAVTETEELIQISTSVFTVNYAKDKDFKASTFGSNINAIINGTDKEWKVNSPEIKNLRAINYSLDSVKDKIILDKGLYSLDGFCIIDDSDSLVLDEKDNFIEREKGIKDWYLFLYNEDFDGCLKDYFTLTGYPSLIPRYALGAWWYKNDLYKEKDIINLVSNFHNNNIPISIFLLGDFWHNNNSYTPNINLKQVSEYLNQNNIKLGVTINPSQKITKESTEYNVIKNYINTDEISFIPFTNEKIYIYLNFIINNLEALGVSTFCIDYNNPLDRINLWKINHYHCGKEEISGKRSLILSRNPNIAPHRYPVIFSGKTKVNWYTLNLLPRYNLQGYNFGISFIAHPIGGYSGGIEEDELYLRYIQFACFSPIFLLASEGGKYYKREPWKWNYVIKSYITNYMNLRYRLLPYLYSESYNYHITGKALVKPFYHDYPKIYDEPLYKNQYFLGRDFFVAPITNKKNTLINRVMKRVYVPNGIWFDFLQGKKYTGNKYYNNFYRDEDYPVFVKAGAIIPMQNTYNEVVPSCLELDIYPLDQGEYYLYEDDGATKNYLRGLYMITKFNYQYQQDNYTFTIKKSDGKNLLSTRSYLLRFKNTKNIKEVNISDKTIKYNCYYDKSDFIVEINNQIVGRDLEVNIKGEDILVSSVRFINEEIKEILYDLQIETLLKEKLDKVLFSDLEIRKKRIKIRKLKKQGLDSKYIKIFINLLEYIEKS